MKTILDDVVSIITIVLNGEDHIEQTILSVLNQEGIKIEYIVIDGGSNDNTLQIIEKYRNQIDVIISEPDNGIYDAINKGIRIARGSLIGLVHCGDYYTKDALSIAFSEYVRTKADIMYGDLEIIEENNNQEIRYFEKPDHLKLREKMSIFHPATFVSNECYSKNGLYEIEYRIASDYELFLRYFINGVVFHYVPKTFSVFREGGVSSKHQKILLMELFKIKRKYLGFLRACHFSLRRTMINNYFVFRKFLVISIIGKRKYFELKYNRSNKLKST